MITQKKFLLKNAKPEKPILYHTKYCYLISMRTQSIDTHPKTEKVLISLIRQKSIANKISQIFSLSQTTIELSKRAILRKNNTLNKNQINILFIKYHYGKDIAKRVAEYLNQKIHEIT